MMMMMMMMMMIVKGTSFILLSYHLCSLDRGFHIKQTKISHVAFACYKGDNPGEISNRPWVKLNSDVS